MLVEGAVTVTAVPAVIVGALVAEGAEEADEPLFAVVMKGSSVIAVGAGYAGPFVAVFF